MASAPVKRDLPWSTYLKDRERSNARNEGINLPLRRSWTVGLWKFSEFILPYEPIRSSAPVAAESVIYIGDGRNKFYAIDLKKKKILWTFKTAGAIEVSPTIGEEAIYAGTNNGVLYAIERKSGMELWRYQARSEIISSPLLMRGMVFFSSADNRLYALDENTGDVVWEHSRIFPRYINNRIFSSPTGDKEWIYYLFPDGYLLCLDAYTGKEMWKRKIQDTTLLNYKSGRRTPEIADGAVYAIDKDGAVVKLDEMEGKELDRYDIIKVVDFIIRDGLIFLIGDNQVITVDKRKHEIFWRRKIESGINLSAFSAGDYLFILSNYLDKPLGLKLFSKRKGRLQSFRIFNGQEIFSDEIDSSLTANGIAYNNKLILVADAGFAIIYTR